MKSKSIIGLIMTCILFRLPVLSMELKDDNPQTNAPQIPITIGKETSNRHRSSSPIVIEAYYQSGYVVFDFYEMYEGALITISNTNTNYRIDYLVNPLDSSVCINISGILSEDLVEIRIITESGETYYGVFAL